MMVLGAAPPVDEITLNFSSGSLMLLNVILGLIMFGVALDISVDDLRQTMRSPKGPLIGLAAQFIAFPAFTFLLTRILDPAPSIALGMILVASCPGGNVSNFIAHLAKSNTMLSIGMTAISTLMAIVMTPINLQFWGSLDPGTDALLRSISLDPVELTLTIVVLLGLPVALGMWLRARRPELARKLHTPMRRASIGFFVVFVAIAFASNWQYFLDYIGLVVFAVLLHNATAISTGYGAARVLKVPKRDARAIAIEIGIQNSALGLVLIFRFFDGLGGMALVAAWWGIWHIIAGMSVAWYWSRRPVDEVGSPSSGVSEVPA